MAASVKRLRLHEMPDAHTIVYQMQRSLQHVPYPRIGKKWTVDGTTDANMLDVCSQLVTCLVINSWS